MTEQATSATPTWFGDDASLFGVLHRPAGHRARGGVLICPPLYAEQIAAHRALRLLAGSLAAEGHLVLRFDYAGTGDSHDPDRPGPAQWVRSISSAANHLRASGCGHLTVIGLRLGATLLSTWLTGHSADAAVLWDPVVSGRRLLRELHAGYQLLTGQAADSDGGDVDTLSFVIPAEVAVAIRGLDLQPVDGLPVLRLDRPGRGTKAQGAGDVTLLTVDGQEEMLEPDVFRRTLPSRTIAAVVDWVGTHSPGQCRPVAPLPTVPVSTFRADDRAIRERIVALGEHAAFAICSTPVDGGTGPTLVLLNTAIDHHIGPGRSWVELARRWAASGRRVLRVDLPGIGESPAVPGRVEARSYEPEFLDDILGIAAVAADGGTTVPIGLCSGAYHALEWALAAPVTAVAAINPVLSFVPPEVEAGFRQDPRRRVSHVPNRTARRLGESGRLARVKQHLPTVAWRIFDLLKWHRVPTDGVRRVVERGVDTLLFLTGDDVDPYLHRGVNDIRAMSDSGHFQLITTGVDDHALLTTLVRRQACELLDQWVAGLPNHSVVAGDIA